MVLLCVGSCMLVYLRKIRLTKSLVLLCDHFNDKKYTGFMSVAANSLIKKTEDIRVVDEASPNDCGEAKDISMLR